MCVCSSSGRQAAGTKRAAMLGFPAHDQFLDQHVETGPRGWPASLPTSRPRLSSDSRRRLGNHSSIRHSVSAGRLSNGTTAPKSGCRKRLEANTASRPGNSLWIRGKPPTKRRNRRPATRRNPTFDLPGSGLQSFEVIKIKDQFAGLYRAQPFQQEKQTSAGCSQPLVLQSGLFVRGEHTGPLVAANSIARGVYMRTNPATGLGASSTSMHHTANGCQPRRS